MVCKVSAMSLLNRFSSHSLAKLLGTEITATLFSSVEMEVFFSQVW
jgi:hypothetical protein